MEALPPEMKLLILRLLVAADLASACQVNKDLFSLEADDQDCLWRRLFLAVCTRLQTDGCAVGYRKWGGTARAGRRFTWAPPSSVAARLAVSISYLIPANSGRLP